MTDWCKEKLSSALNVRRRGGKGTTESMSDVSKKVRSK